jgi:hypothetical protein
VTDDFEVASGLTLGEWLHREIEDSFVLEVHGWAPERCSRVAARLQSGRPETDRLEVVVPWIQQLNAFTAPGRYIYFCRRLLERCPDDETAAFVIAHEIAHHDLGHLKLIPDWMPRFAVARGGAIAVATISGIERRIYGPERECDADRHGIDLCIRAGYDPERCLRFFPILEQVALDLGDQSAVYGPDKDSDEELSPNAPWYTKARMWAWQRTHGYLPLSDRHAALRHYLEGEAGWVERG